MKVLWAGDAGSASGFSRVTHAIGERLVAKGHEVHVLASMYGGDWVDTTLKLHRADLLDSRDFKGRKRIVPLLLELQPDAVVILEDPWVVAGFLWNDADPAGLLRKGPVTPIAYMPVDGAPLPAKWRVMPVNAVAMSKFGQGQLPGSRYIPHGIDGDLFRPVEDQPITLRSGVVSSQRECKQAFGFDPDGFLVLRVDRNSWRKDFAATWKALIPVMVRHLDVEAHFHCLENDPAGGPILPALFSRRPDYVERFHTPAGYSPLTGWSNDELVALYNAADVFVSTSMGEGFGLTIAESLACGTPVIAQDCSAISEVAAMGSLLIPPGKPITAPGGLDLRMAEPGEFSAMIEAIYAWSAEAREALGRQGREHVLAEYNWDVSAASFDEVITNQAQQGREARVSSPV